MLHELGEPHSGIEERGEDLAESVVPAVAESVGEDDLSPDVGACLRDDSAGTITRLSGR
jgi:hypothetical protein